MIIEEPYFKLTPIDGTLFDLELLRVINKGKKTERKEFKPEAYGVTLEKAIRIIAHSKLEDKYKNSSINLATYLKDQKQIYEDLKKTINI